MTNDDYKELQRYRDLENEIYERDKAERLANERWLSERKGDLKRRKDNGERFELGEC